jgi:multiple sugar transport system permease protein
MSTFIQKIKKPGILSLTQRETIAAYFFLLPWLIGFLVFLLIPLLMSLYAAFTHWTLINPPPRWIGLENFRTMLFDDQYFGWSLGVTAKYMVLTLIPSIGLGVALALLLNQKLRGMYLARTIFYVPAVLSGVAVTILWMNLLHPELGAINTMLRSLGVQNPPGWLSSADWAVPAVALMSIWGVGGAAIIYLAGLQNIPAHLYEKRPSSMGPTPGKCFGKSPYLCCRRPSSLC